MKCDLCLARKRRLIVSHSFIWRTIDMGNDHADQAGHHRTNADDERCVWMDLDTRAWRTPLHTRTRTPVKWLLDVFFLCSMQRIAGIFFFMSFFSFILLLYTFYDSNWNWKFTLPKKSGFREKIAERRRNEKKKK